MPFETSRFHLDEDRSRLGAEPHLNIRSTDLCDWFGTGPISVGAVIAVHPQAPVG